MASLFQNLQYNTKMQHIQTFSAYSPENLLYKYEELGGKETFQTKTVVEKDWKKWLDWPTYINQETIEAMDQLRILLRKYP